MISHTEARTRIRCREDLYNALKLNQYHVPKIKDPIMTN